MKIKLRKYRETDLDRHLELFLMNDIYKKLNDNIRKQEREWLIETIKNYKKEKPKFFTLAIILDNCLIGNLVAEKIDYKNKTLDIGFWIGRDYWNKGITTIALKIFLGKIIRKFKPKKIIAKHKKDNLASGRILEKAGFKFEREKRGTKIYSKSLTNNFK